MMAAKRSMSVAEGWGAGDRTAALRPVEGAQCGVCVPFDQMPKVTIGIFKKDHTTAATGWFNFRCEFNALLDQQITSSFNLIDAQSQVTPASQPIVTRLFHPRIT